VRDCRCDSSEPSREYSSRRSCRSRSRRTRAYSWGAMHTSELRSDEFAITLAGEPAAIHEVLPDFDDHDRLGVVVRQPCGGVGASGLLLAAMAAFYELQRARDPAFYIYADYFLFEVGGLLGDHSMLDVWPTHKEVVVPDEPGALLEAINDRAITWLIVEDREPTGAELARGAVASARNRIRGAFAYSPQGRVADADLRIGGNDRTESYVNHVLDPAGLLPTLANDTTAGYTEAVARRAGEVAPAVRARIRAQRDALREHGRTVETYRRITLDQALALL
jgi:hypothetical protein